MRLAKTPICLIIGCVLLVSQPAVGQDDIKKKSEKIHAEVFTVDSHNDTPMSFGDTGFNMAERHDFNKGGSRMDFPRMKEGGLDGAFFAVFIGQGPLNDEGRNNAYNRAKTTFDQIYSTAAKHSDMAAIALTPSDGIRINREGKSAMFIGVENGYPVGQELSRIQEFYNLGARYLTLCHSRNNDICDSSTDPTGPLHDGLSEFGKRVVAEMNRVGMMIDVSHISDKSFFDVISESKVPVIASHSCARALCDNPRNLTDEMIIALAKNGGVLQMCILSGYVREPEPNPARDSAQAALRQTYGDWSKLSPEKQSEARAAYAKLRKQYPEKMATVSEMVDHIDHVVKIAGIDHIGIGTDFDGGGGLADCNDASEMGTITYELVKRGYSKKDIAKIWSGNLFRVMDEVSNFSSKQNN